MGRLVPLRFLFWGTGENKVTNRNQNSLVPIGEALGGMDGPVKAIHDSRGTTSLGYDIEKEYGYELD